MSTLDELMSLRIESQLKAKLKNEATSKGVSMNTLVIEAIRLYLNK